MFSALAKCDNIIVP